MTDFGLTMDATAYLSNYGAFAYGPNLIVYHSLECDAIPHIAEQLSARGGYLDNEGLAPQRMTDPVAIVKTIPDGDQGGHIGGPGNSHCAGVETSGRAGWTPEQWAEPNARAAVDHQARAVAGLAIVYGWSLSDLRWLSIAEVRAGARGCCDHNTISQSGISNTNHWDVGLGYPFAWAMERTRYWFQVMTGGNPTTPSEDDSMSAADVAELKAYIDAKFTAFRTDLWTTGITGQGPGQHANEMLAQVSADSHEAAVGAREVGVRTWITGITGQGKGQHANEILAGIAGSTQRIEANQNDEASPATPPPVTAATYIVATGDTLITIATAKGIADWHDLVTWNKLANADAINPGDVLRLAP